MFNYILRYEQIIHLISTTTMSMQSFRFWFNVLLDRLQALLQNRVMSVLYITSAIVCLFAGRSFLALVFMAMVIYSNPLLIWQLQGRYRKVLGRFRLNAVMLTGIVVGLLAGITLCLAFVEPSHAQFFNNAQTFMTRAFQSTTPNANNAQAAAVIPLVMNTLRMLFVMYMLFGIVQVFQAVRQGEEWKDLARTPFFVMLAGTMGDVLVGAIAGP
jgi:hypothetical protein